MFHNFLYLLRTISIWRWFYRNIRQHLFSRRRQS